MALPNGVTTATLTFGPYADADGNVQFEGMTGLIVPSSPVRHIATGAVIVQQPIKVVIGQGGVGTVVLPQTDQAGINPQGFTYTVTWQVGRFDSSPGNLTFALPVGNGTTIDFDTLVPATGGVVVPTGVVSINNKTGNVTLTASDVGADAAGAATAAQAAAVAAAATDATSKATAAQAAALAGSTPLQRIAATVTTAGALAVNRHNPVDATSGPLTMTLPTGQPEGAQIVVEKTDASANTVTVSGSLRGVAGQTIALVWQRETIMVRADSAGSWWPIAGHKAKASLDTAYAGQVTDTAMAGALGSQTAAAVATRAELRAAIDAELVAQSAIPYDGGLVA